MAAAARTVEVCLPLAEDAGEDARLKRVGEAAMRKASLRLLP